MADKYGPIFTFKLGLHPALVLSSWEMTKECFTTNDLAVSSRPKLLAAKHLGYNYAMAAFSPHGSYWRELRTITTLELLSNHRLEQLSYMRVSEVETSLKELQRLWTLKKNESSHIINIYIYITKAFEAPTIFHVSTVLKKKKTFLKLKQKKKKKKHF